MEIYRAYIWGSCDSCSEFWENLYIGSFHTTKAGVEKEIEPVKGLKGRELEKALHKLYDINAYVGDNTPEIETFVLVND